MRAPSSPSPLSQPERSWPIGRSWAECLVLVVVLVLGSTLAGALTVLEAPGLTLVCHAVLAAGLHHVVGRASHHPVRDATILGTVFALAQHGVGHHWVYSAMAHQAQAGPGWASFGTLVFIVYLSLFTALPVAVWALWRQRALRQPTAQHLTPALSAAVMAALLTLGEYGRGLLFNGFTTLTTGNAWVDSVWGRGGFPLVGVYGVSGASLWVSAWLGGLLSSMRDRPKAPWTPWLRWGLCCSALAIGSWTSDQVAWTEPVGQPLSYRLLQFNTGLTSKFDAAQATQLMQRHLDDIQQTRADLIVTPETAFVQPLSRWSPQALASLRQFSQDSHSHLMLGVFTTTAQAQGHNSLLHIAPQGALQRYDKTLLMPFGEYTPAGLGWFMDRLSIPLKDLSPGPWPPPHWHGRIDREPALTSITPAAQVGVMICQEDSRGATLRPWLPKVTLWVNPSDLAWFEGSAAVTQRTRLAQARALETGRAVLRVGNTGETVHIDPHGRRVAALPLSTAAELDGQVQGYQGLTPYARWGDGPVGLAMLLCLGWGLRRAQRVEASTCGRSAASFRISSPNSELAQANQGRV